MKREWTCNGDPPEEYHQRVDIEFGDPCPICGREVGDF